MADLWVTVLQTVIRIQSLVSSRSRVFRRVARPINMISSIISRLVMWVSDPLMFDNGGEVPSVVESIVHPRRDARYSDFRV